MLNQHIIQNCIGSVAPSQIPSRYDTTLLMPYVDSSEDEEQFSPPKPSTSSLRQPHYTQQLGNIVRSQIQRLQMKELQVQPNDKHILTDLQRRQQKYEYFLHQMEVDAKYQRKLAQRSRKLQAQNDRKEQIHARQKAADERREQVRQQAKMEADRNSKQDNVGFGVKRIVHQLTVERKVLAEKAVSSHLQQQRQAHKNELDSLARQQQNQLEELRQLYEEVKVEKRVNQLDQRAQLQDMQRLMQQKKAILKQQLTLSKDFRF